MNLFTASALLLAIGVASPSGADAACSTPHANTVKVTCVAAEGTTEEQHPKGDYGPNYAPPGTDCNAIPIPEDVTWLYCLRTVQFNFDWTYDGPRPTTLIGLTRTVNNDKGEYPDDLSHDLLTSYWGAPIWEGVSLTNTYHQIVVDLCKQPITYTYDLDVTVADASGECTDTDSYVYEITANEAEESGYCAFKNGCGDQAQSADPADEIDPRQVEKAEESINVPEEPSSSSATGAKVGLAAVSGILAVLSFFL